MASLGMRCGVNSSARLRTDRSNRIHRFSHCVSIPISKTQPQRISASSTPTGLRVFCQSSSRYGDDLISRDKIANAEENRGTDFVVSGKLDEWMRDSVVEIVKNLKQAPLLVHLYDNGNGSGSTELKTEKGVAENWADLTRKWRDGERPSPDGIILVEELKDKRDLYLEQCKEDDHDDDDDETRAWGVVIQGRGGGVERACGGGGGGPACYLLKTSSVGSGVGLVCSHFCLMRVNNFKESALSQLSNCWLLQ